jgi:hypothetical protein
MNDWRKAARKLAHSIGTHSRQQKINADFSAVAYAATQKSARWRASCCGRERI